MKLEGLYDKPSASAKETKALAATCGISGRGASGGQKTADSDPVRTQLERKWAAILGPGHQIIVRVLKYLYHALYLVPFQS